MVKGISMQKYIKAVFILLIAFSLFTCSNKNKNTDNGFKILFVNSYHNGYEWSDGIFKGIAKSFDLIKESEETYYTTNRKIVLKQKFLNSKNIKNEKMLKTKAYQINQFSEQWQPDIVISSDDNAAKYVVVPYLKNTDTPVVFCGINWDAGGYGFPCENVTGIIETQKLSELTIVLEKYSKGKKFGEIMPNTYTSKKVHSYLVNDLKKKPEVCATVNNFTEFKEQFLKMQTTVDYIFIHNYAGIENWEKEKAIDFILENQIIPSGSTADWMQPYILVGVANIPFEQGLLAANYAKKILNGESPESLPIIAGTRSKLFFNAKIAKKLNINFDEVK